MGIFRERNGEFSKKFTKNNVMQHLERYFY